MYIKAKYPKVGREWYRQGVQGFGSLYGGNQISDVENVDTRLVSGLINRLSTSYMFGGNIVSLYINTNNGNELVFTNDSAFLISSSTLDITEIDTQRALEFSNESDWVNGNLPPDLLLLNTGFNMLLEDGSNIVINE